MSTVNLSKSQIETIIQSAYQMALNDVANNIDLPEDVNLRIDMQVHMENAMIDESRAAMNRYSVKS